jgi:hypothetical protein
VIRGNTNMATPRQWQSASHRCSMILFGLSIDQFFRALLC